MRIDLGQPSQSFDCNSPQNAFVWNNCNICWYNNRIRVTSPNINCSVLFDSIEFYNDHNIAIGHFVSAQKQLMKIINSNGCCSVQFESYDCIIEDDPNKYLIVHKTIKEGNQNRANRLYIIDLFDAKDTIDKSPTTHAAAPAWREIVDIRDGIAEIMRDDANYCFCAVQTYPALINGHPTSMVSSYEYIKRWKYKIIVQNSTNYHEETQIDFSRSMYSIPPPPTIKDNNSYHFKAVVIKASNHRIKVNNTYLVNVPKKPLNDVVSICQGEGVIVTRFGYSRAYLVRHDLYNVNRKVEGRRSFSSSLPLGLDHDVYYITGENEDVVRFSDIESYLTDLIDKISTAEDKDLYTPEDFVAETTEQTTPLIEEKYRPILCSHIDNDVRIKVFNFTKDIINDSGYKDQNGNWVNININHDLLAETKVYKEKIEIVPSESFNTAVRVVIGDCLDVAKQLIDAGDNADEITVLNMSSSHAPGGRAETGAKTQEAYLYRCTDYSVSLEPQKDKYPLDQNFGGIYSPGVTVFRKSESEHYALLDKPWPVNIIAVSALRRPVDENAINGYVICMKNKIRTMLNIAIANGQTNLVLGAFGCGGLQNIPSQIARMFHDVLSEHQYVHAFKQIIFAILDNSETINAFETEFVEGTLTEVNEVDNSEIVEGISQARRNIIRASRIIEHFTRDEIQEISREIDLKTLRIDSERVMYDRDYMHYLKCLFMLVFASYDKAHSPLRLDFLWENISSLDGIDDIVNYFNCEAPEESDFWDNLDELYDDGYDEDIIVIGYLKYLVTQFSNTESLAQQPTPTPEESIQKDKQTLATEFFAQKTVSKSYKYEYCVVDQEEYDRFGRMILTDTEASKAKELLLQVYNEVYHDDRYEDLTDYFDVFEDFEQANSLRGSHKELDALIFDNLNPNQLLRWIDLDTPKKVYRFSCISYDLKNKKALGPKQVFINLSDDEYIYLLTEQLKDEYGFSFNTLLYKNIELAQHINFAVNGSLYDYELEHDMPYLIIFDEIIEDVNHILNQ